MPMAEPKAHGHLRSTQMRTQMRREPKGPQELHKDTPAEPEIDVLSDETPTNADKADVQILSVKGSDEVATKPHVATESAPTVLLKSEPVEVKTLETPQLASEKYTMKERMQKYAISTDAEVHNDTATNATGVTPEITKETDVEQVMSDVTKERVAKRQANSDVHRATQQEGHLIDSLRHMGPQGEEAVGCVTACRFGEERHTWKDCIERCVVNRLMRSTFLSMLPAEKHDAHAAHVELPKNIKMSEETRTKYMHKLQRAAEL